MFLLDDGSVVAYVDCEDDRYEIIDACPTLRDVHVLGDDELGGAAALTAAVNDDLFFNDFGELVPFPGTDRSGVPGDLFSSQELSGDDFEDDFDESEEWMFDDCSCVELLGHPDDCTCQDLQFAPTTFHWVRYRPDGVHVASGCTCQELSFFDVYKVLDDARADVLVDFLVTEIAAVRAHLRSLERMVDGDLGVIDDGPLCATCLVHPYDHMDVLDDELIELVSDLSDILADGTYAITRVSA